MPATYAAVTASLNALDDLQLHFVHKHVDAYLAKIVVFRDYRYLKSGGQDGL
jgi:hypothetical protein